MTPCLASFPLSPLNSAGGVGNGSRVAMLAIPIMLRGPASVAGSSALGTDLP